MSKKDTTYSDAMNEWAAKQSFLRNRKNRLIHPNPELPVPFQVLGYLFRVAILVFVLWIAIFTLSQKYYNGEAFNEKFATELQSFLKADELEVANISWQRGVAGCKKIRTTMGSEAAFYRKFEATKVSFAVPLLNRLRGKWNADEVLIDHLLIDLKSGGKTQGRVGDAAVDGDLNLKMAGIFPAPKLAEATINQVTCRSANLGWGLSNFVEEDIKDTPEKNRNAVEPKMLSSVKKLSSAIEGAIEGTRLELYSGTPQWRMDLTGGKLRQNWLSGLAIESLTVRRDGAKLSVSDGVVRLGKSTEPGNLGGTVSLGRLPRIDLKLELPEVHTRDMISSVVEIPEFFYGVLDLSLDIKGSINTPAGVEMSGRGRFRSGTFSKVPVFEAVDQLLKTNRFRIFSIAEGEIEFTTGGGKLDVTKFACTSKGGSTALRGSFTFVPAVTIEEAEAANASPMGNERVRARPDEIKGVMHLGVRSKLLEGNVLAEKYFTESSDGYVWIEIPLAGSINQATKEQQGKILADLRERN